MFASHTSLVISLVASLMSLATAMSAPEISGLAAIESSLVTLLLVSMRVVVKILLVSFPLPPNLLFQVLILQLLVT